MIDKPAIPCGCKGKSRNPCISRDPGLAQKGGFEPLYKFSISVAALSVLFFRLQINLQNFCKLLVDGVCIVIFHRPDRVEVYGFQHVVGLVAHALLGVSVGDSDRHCDGGGGVSQVVETVMGQPQLCAQAGEAHIDCPS